MRKGEEAVVVGGGVAGLWAAWALADAGYPVKLLEASTTGMGASSGNAGWICPAQTGPLPEPGLVAHGIRDLAKRDSSLHVTLPALLRLAPWGLRFMTYCNQHSYDRGVEALSRLGYPSFKLIERLGLDKYCDKNGMLAVARRRDDVEHFVDKINPLSVLGQTALGEILDGDDVQGIDPVIPSGYSAVLVGDHWQIIPDEFNRALVEQVRLIGVDIIEHCVVQGFDAARGHVRAVHTDRGRFGGAHVVLAAGAATTGLAKELGFPIPVVGGKGYSIDVHPSAMPRRAILTLDSHLAISPMGDRVRIAGAMDFSNRPAHIPEARITSMKRSAESMIGRWKQERPAWSGLRPVAPDGMPLIGRLAPHSNVFVATGYSMLGMTIAPTAGTVLAAAIRSGDDGSSGPFSPQRFTRHARRSTNRAITQAS